MTKDFLLRLTEEHYGAGVFPVYGRLLEEQRLAPGGPLLPMWYCTAALRRAFGGKTCWCWAAPTTRCWRTCWVRRR